MDNSMNNENLEQLATLFTTFVEKATYTIKEFLDSDVVLDTVDLYKTFEEDLGDAIKAFKMIKAISSIPSKLYLRKFERFCKGMIEIPLDKRQKYLNILGHKKFREESYFILNVINRIEEEDKIPFLVKLLEARTENVIDSFEYRRLTILIDRTLYEDLLYLEHNITADPVALCTTSDFGLVSSGLLVTAGNEWIADPSNEDGTLNDTGVRFNYTSAAKKLALILFGVQCKTNPTNKGIEKLQLDPYED